MSNNLHDLPGYSFEQHHLPKRKLSAGSLKGKKPVKIDDRTTAYVVKAKGKKYCDQVKERYLRHIENFGK